MFGDYPQSTYTTYQINYGDTWTNISFKFYNTIGLWWLICKFNNIINPFTEITPGKFIKIPSEQVVKIILSNINE